MNLDNALCGVPYHITEQDGQVMFEAMTGFYGCFNRFAFEWKGCGWYLVDVEGSFDRVFVPHIVAAYKWVEENFEIIWDNGTGTTKRK